MKPDVVAQRIEQIESRPDHWERCFHVVLVEPLIPQNTGNIARLCAGTRSVLHLVEPLGFSLADRYLKRAGLDYWRGVTMVVHHSFDSIESCFPERKLWLFSTKGQRGYHQESFGPGDALCFGSETKGLPDEVRSYYDRRVLRIPISGEVRSLNLANSVAIVLYEALRQADFEPIVDLS